ncbi:hypothetical protein FPRO03_13197 [Fusarium proliferatum]|nr:hypothetical protein FPRO03_13197 [Fusarium proliferatum]
MKFLALITATILPMLGFVSADCPPGAHVKTGTTPHCDCNPDGSITCAEFQVCGVGNTGATFVFEDTWTATVQCQNKGGKIVEVKSTDQNTSNNRNLTPDENGCLTVPGGTLSQPTDADFTSQATCPNGNWEKIVEGDSPTRTSFTYTLTLDDCPTTFTKLPNPCLA